MIISVLTPYKLGSREHIDLNRFLEESKQNQSRNLIRLPTNTVLYNQLTDKNHRGATHIVREFNLKPRRAVVLDARDPDLLYETLNEFAQQKKYKADFLLLLKNLM